MQDKLKTRRQYTQSLCYANTGKQITGSDKKCTKIKSLLLYLSTPRYQFLQSRRHIFSNYTDSQRVYAPTLVSSRYDCKSTNEMSGNPNNSPYFSKNEQMTARLGSLWQVLSPAAAMLMMLMMKR